MSKHGLLIVVGENGSPHAVPIDLPIETHADVLMWGEDFLRKVNEFSALRKFVLRLVLGRYAYRELVGLRDSIEEHGYSTRYDYGLESMDYHKEKVKL